MNCLKPSAWFNDGLIDTFLCGLCQRASHQNDLRFAVLDPQATHLYRYEITREGVSRMLNGVAMHDVDRFVWAIPEKQHWYLCIVYVQQRNFVLIDPFIPSRKVQNKPFVNLVLETLCLISASYDKKFNLHNIWSLVSPKHLHKKHHLLSQPRTNGNDCGVLVCLYAWAIMTDQEMENLNDSTFEEEMANARMTIGSYLYDWGDFDRD